MQPLDPLWPSAFAIGMLPKKNTNPRSGIGGKAAVTAPTAIECPGAAGFVQVRSNALVLPASCR